MSINIQEHMSLQGWQPGNLPPQAGKLAVVTGAASGLGYEIALALAQGCADVIVAGRNEAKGREAVGKLRMLAPKALVRFERLDLANLASVSDFAGRLGTAGRPVDLLVNNAGVMALPKRLVTADGFEMQLGTNYLGHFALTGLLLPLLRLSRGPRVVQVSSLAHRYGQIRFDDLQGERRYRPWAAYFQSKLASLLFACELQRRSDAHRWGLLSSAVHPVSQSAADGALPALFALASADAQPGGFYGPGGLFEFAGPPAAAYVFRRARDQAVARKLWQVAEQLTGVKWPAD